jgi:hypothetical protein
MAASKVLQPRSLLKDKYVQICTIVFLAEFSYFDGSKSAPDESQYIDVSEERTASIFRAEE